jgi:hypothetical protein
MKSMEIRESIIVRSESSKKSENESADSRRDQRKLSPSKVSRLLSKVDRSLSSLASVDSSQRMFKSSTDEALFRAMRHTSITNSTSTDSSSTAKKVIRSSVDRLSRPKSANVILHNSVASKYATSDDQANCTFRPKVMRRKGDADSDEEKSDSKFLERQEAQERARRNELDDSIGKAKYDSLVSKRECSTCGSKQSYDEVKEKRKKCPNCRTEYSYKVDWSKVGSRFFRRAKEYTSKHEEQKLKILTSVLDGYKVKRKVFDKEKNMIVDVVVDPFVKIKWTEEREKEFFERLNEYNEKRLVKLKLIEKEAYDQTCTFKPHRVKKDAENDEDYDAFRAFMDRFEADLERRTEVQKENLLKREADENYTGIRHK